MGRITKVIICTMSVLVAMYFFNGNEFDPKSIEDKRVLITGASTGIGEHLAYHYSKLGARVVITARREDALKTVAKKCKELGARQIEIVAADMGNATDRSKVVGQTQTFLGGLDHLILNHGWLIHGWWQGSIANMTSMESGYHVNYLSYVDIASKCLEMLTASRGNIGVMSSAFGEFGSARTTIYSSYKFALHGFFSSLRQELIAKNKGVSVTIVVMGLVSSDSFKIVRETEIPHVPLGLMATPSDAAEVILVSVAQRVYNVRYNNFMRLSLLLKDFMPAFYEDFYGKLLLDDDSTFLLKMTRWIIRCIYE